MASRITVSSPSSTNEVTVTGSAGAVPSIAAQTGKDWLRIVAVDWGAETCVRFAAAGSFSTTLAAGPGSTILLAATNQAFCQGQMVEGAAAAVMRVPEGVNYTDASMPLSISGQNQWGRWLASGNLAGASPFLEFSFPEGAPSDCTVPRLHVHRLFDAAGEYAGQVALNVHGPSMTPTGLPIETNAGPAGYWALVTPSIPGRSITQQCLNANSRFELGDWTSGFEAGWYRSRIVFYTVSPGGLESMERFQSASFNGGIEQSSGIGYLPLVSVGNAQTPRLTATLLNESPSWGSAGIRGVVAREDEGRFALGSRRAAQGPYIASPNDPLSGRSLSYLLEPFLPTLSHNGFVAVGAQVPLIAFDEAQPGTISVTLRKPDGSTEALASNAPVLQSFIAGSHFNSTPVENSFSGPGRTYGVTTGLPSLDVRFDQYGLHVVTLTGSLRTLWGQDLRLSSTFEVWVAQPLDLSLGTFEGTPLDVGAEWSPVVVVQPGVPAEVQVTIDHYVDGDASQRQTFNASGTANRFGYFVADSAWRPQSHGEYVARVTASYTDPLDGTLWMGTRAGASIVATPNTSLIAHGERNRQLANIPGDSTLRTWFFTRTFDPNCGEAACDPIVNPDARSVGNYPFFRGDVAWLADMSPIGPSITLQDPAGLLDTIAPQVATATNWCSRTYCATADDMKQLSITTTAGSGGHHRPDAVDSWAYWYTSSIRHDGIHVDHTVSELASEHNHWYGHDSYNCQIGLTCYDAWNNGPLGDRNGDEEGDVKLFFGGAVIKAGGQQHFVPYASMGVIVPQAISQGGGSYLLGDERGNRVCPPYQGAAGGLATCGPLLTVDGREVDLFVTPTGTRPGSVLELGDTFVFSGQAWPTLDVGITVTITSPSGQVRTFDGRASSVGYIDAQGKSFTVDEPGAYTVHVALTQDRPVPSTGLAPDPPIVADGRTVLSQHGYAAPLSAILGSSDSTYTFFVAEPRDDIDVSTNIDLTRLTQKPVPGTIDVTFQVPAGASSLRYTVGIKGLVIMDQTVTASGGQVTIRLDQSLLYSQGRTGVVLGADSIEITLAGEIGGQWFAESLNLRGLSPLGGEPAVVTSGR